MATKPKRTIEWKTTSARYALEHTYKDICANYRNVPDNFPDPIPPEGPGWRMTGSASHKQSEHYGVMFWFWEREAPVKEPKRVEKAVGT